MPPRPQSTAQAFGPKAEFLGSSVEEHRAAMAKELGLSSPEALPLVLLPANRARSSLLSERRKKRFRAHLRKVVEEAFAIPLEPLPTPKELGDSPLLEQACATCRGRCCHAGGDHAFVDIAAIHAYRHAHPNASPDEIIDAYLARLGERTLDAGCVFQGEAGCLLERTMRAAICNQFLCSPLEPWRASEALGTDTRALAVAMHGETIVRLSVIASTQS